MGIFEHYQSRYEERKQEEFTIGEFLEICKEDQTAYAKVLLANSQLTSAQKFSRYLGRALR